MLDPTTDTAASLLRGRTLRRAAGTLGAAVVLATVGPAIANAAGADVANPVAVALRASGKSLASAFSTADDPANPCVTPGDDGTEVSATPSVDASATPSESVAPIESGSPTDTVEGTAGPDDTVSADPSATPTEAPATDSTEDCDEADPSESPSETPSESASETPAGTEEEAEESNHGQIVSTVARCAPRGKDPLLDVEGAPSNHGGYVKVAAHGGTLTLPWGTYDLSTQAGADDLCASLEAAAADLADEEAAESKAKKGKAEKAKKAKPAKPAKAGKGRGGKR